MAASSNNFEQKLPNGVIVCVDDGDIFDNSADVLVCSSGKSVKNQGAIADQLKTRGGKGCISSLNNLYDGKYKLGEGDVYEIHPGDLQKDFSIIYLAVTGQYIEPIGIGRFKIYDPWGDDLKTLYSKILSKADKDGRRSITIPVLGSGRAGGPVDICIEVAIECINKFKPINLVHVNIVTNTFMTYKQIRDVLKSTAPKYSTSKSASASSKKTTNDSLSVDKFPTTDSKRNKSYAQVSVGLNDPDIDKYHNIKTENRRTYSLKNGKPSSYVEQDFDSESVSNYRKMSDAQKTENRSNKQKPSCVDTFCKHCKKAFNAPNCTPACDHRLCRDCAGSKDPCPIFQDDDDVKEDSTSRKQKTCDHCKDVIRGPDCTLRCGHIACSKCQASKYSCLDSQDNGPEVDQYLQELSSKGDSDDSDDTDVEDDHIKEEEDDIETCAICMEVPLIPKCLTKCGHVFCTDCIETRFKFYKPACPTCGTTYGILTGNQPTGVMEIMKLSTGVEGEERAGCYQINYVFSSGVQDENHLNPGIRYLPTSRTAYLPATTEGKKVCKMLIVAFKRKLIFTVGRSRTTGLEDRITWNDILHKTSMNGGLAHFGYPDPTYLNRVMEELASKGITEDDIRDVELRDHEVIHA
ncbi:uncharacterized protein LOC126814269 [Patella vulgata]|uniref:uncharacterized protein LOC126814269 n=1 Tax=Patella vulgata TaxID=6465 RepID=UPI0021808576|nr:uncharacterized protein LOC126814269 [Patella vulgata]XP_050395303.1 uncharacterized protein LOC126814269 [Patella vulgata]